MSSNISFIMGHQNVLGNKAKSCFEYFPDTAVRLYICIEYTVSGLTRLGHPISNLIFKCTLESWDTSYL